VPDDASEFIHPYVGINMQADARDEGEVGRLAQFLIAYAAVDALSGSLYSLNAPQAKIGFRRGQLVVS